MSAPVLFTVPGPPVPKGRPRVVRGHAFTPQKTVAYERKIATCARAAGVRALPAAAQVEIDFYLPNRRRQDIDNLTKAILDGLNGVAWADDSQVEALHVRKFIDAREPRAVVTVGDLVAQP